MISSASDNANNKLFERTLFVAIVLSLKVGQQHHTDKRLTDADVDKTLNHTVARPKELQILLRVSIPSRLIYLFKKLEGPMKTGTNNHKASCSYPFL